MPNWCECDLRVSGKADKVREFKLAVACPDDQTVFRINNILPTPVTLLEAEAGTLEIIHAIVHCSDEAYQTLKKLHQLDSDDRQVALAQYMIRNEISDARYREHMELYKKNHECYGHLTWYTWRMANWGTKWDTDSSRIVTEEYGGDGRGNIIFQFSTAWSPPMEALTSISRRFSFLTFRMRYFEGALGFKGFTKIRNGEILAYKTGSYSGGRGG